MSLEVESTRDQVVLSHTSEAMDASDDLPPMPAGTDRTVRIPPPGQGTWFWYVIWGIVWFLRLFSARLVAEGRGNLPRKGGCVVTCNHTRGFDFIPLGYCSPRQVYYMVKAEAFEWNPILSWVLHSGGGMPVRRGKGDAHAVQQAIAKVQEGFPVALFPEGTRSPDGTLQPAYTGAVRIAMHAGAPLVPAVVVGAEEMLRQIRKPWVRPLVTVRFGAPIAVAGDPADKEQVAAATREVMLAMAAMLPPNMRGIWADGVGRVVGAGETRARRQQLRGADSSTKESIAKEPIAKESVSE